MAVLKNVPVLFSNVVNVDDFSQKYQIVVSLTEEQAADAEDEGIKVKTKEYDGKTQYQAAFKTKFRPRVVDATNKDYDLQGSEVGRGSTISVQYKFREWKAPGGKTGTSADLVAIQLIDLKSAGSVEFEEVDSEFGEGDSDI